MCVVCLIKNAYHDFSAFQFSLQLMLEQALTNLILICLMISQKNYNNIIQKLHKRASMLQWILGSRVEKIMIFLK